VSIYCSLQCSSARWYCWYLHAAKTYSCDRLYYCVLSHADVVLVRYYVRYCCHCMFRYMLHCNFVAIISRLPTVGMMLSICRATWCILITFWALLGTILCQKVFLTVDIGDDDVTFVIYSFSGQLSRFLQILLHQCIVGYSWKNTYSNNNNNNVLLYWFYWWQIISCCCYQTLFCDCKLILHAPDVFLFSHLDVGSHADCIYLARKIRHIVSISLS